jgi:copper(I)-binding protein
LRKLTALLITCILLIVPNLAQAHSADDIIVENIWGVLCGDDVLVTFAVRNIESPHPIGLSHISGHLSDQIELVSVGDDCETEVVERVIIPFESRFDLASEGYAVKVSLDEPLQAFALILSFDMLDDDFNHNGNPPVDVFIGVPVVETLPTDQTITITKASVRPSAEQGDTTTPAFPSAVYMTITNDGESDDTLISAYSPLAEITEIHETTIQNEVMRMNETNAIPVSSGESVTFASGGYHIMLINLYNHLYDGDAVPVTLTFASGLEVDFVAPVYDSLGGGHHDHSAHSTHDNHAHGDH